MQTTFQTKFKLRDYQERAVRDILKREQQKAHLYAGPTGCGKCFKSGTKILMFDGSVKRVEDIVVGDRLMGPDSAPRTVLNLSHGFGPLYRVTPVKGDPYTVNENHILSLKRTPETKGQKHRIVNVSVREYLGLSNFRKHTLKGWRTGVDFPSQPVPIPAYILGLWIGDGRTLSPTVYTPDIEVKNAWIAYGQTLGLTASITQQPGCEAISLVGRKGGTPNPLLETLRDMGLTNEKYVPREYLINDRQTRLGVIAGLLDTDGHLSDSFDFISKYRHISESLVFLCRSVGLAAYLTESEKICSNNGVKGTYYRVSISGDLSIIPTRVVRKKPANRRQIKNVLVTGISVERVGEGEYCGVEVDKDHLCLLSDFTVTHNSIVELEALSQMPGSLLVTPRLEIIAGMLDKQGVNCSSFSDQKLAEIALDYRITTPVRLRNKLAKGEMDFLPDQLIIDECFPAGTLVDGKRIETIKVGDTVTSFDEVLGTTQPRKVTRIFKNPAPNTMVRLTVRGHVLWCTLTHPIYTQNGWKNASQITPDDRVVFGMQSVGSVYTKSKITGEERETELLFPEVYSRRNSESQIGSNDTNQPEICFGTHETKQSDATCSRQGKNDRESKGHRTQADGTGRKRNRVIRMRTDIIGRDRITLRDCDNRAKGKRAAHTLQNRFNRTVGKTGDRSGWRESSNTTREGSGPTENGFLSWARVDSVTVHEFRSERKRRKVCGDNYVYNIEVEGEHTYFANGVVVHNCHHSIADTYQDITAFLPGRTIFGLTATPYRGTPRSTKDFYDLWNNEVTWIITLQKAAQRGIISVPKVEIWPLIDDDLIKVVNGEFQTESIGDVTRPHLKVVAERCRQFLTDSGWDMPTLFAVPSTDLVVDLVDRLNEAGCPAVGVTQKTTRVVRNKAFADCIAGRVAVVQIDVVSEGVDLPIRRLIDLRATMSPVRWIQQVGRITRPGGQSYYIVCNRNLERHAYLMEGLIPSAKIAEGQKAFPTPTTRAVTRAIGLEGIGRFSPAEVQLADGCVGQLYSLYSNDEFKKTEWAVLLHPAVPTPLVAFKENARTDDGRVDYKKRWQRVDTLPSDLRGFASSPPGYLSDKQQTWWNKSAYYRGIDTAAKATRKNFQALAVLENTNTFFRVGGW